MKKKRDYMTQGKIKHEEDNSEFGIQNLFRTLKATISKYFSTKISCLFRLDKLFSSY